MSFIKQNNKWFNTLNQFIKGENGSTYNGSLVARIRVVTIIEQKATDTNLANAILNLIKEDYQNITRYQDHNYLQSAEVTIKLNGKILEKDKDYTVEY